MPQAENVISFPVNAATTDFLRDFIASPEARLDEIVSRMSGVAAVLFLVRNANCGERVRYAALSLAETAAEDCVRIAELRPVA